MALLIMDTLSGNSQGTALRHASQQMLASVCCIRPDAMHTFVRSELPWLC